MQFIYEQSQEDFCVPPGSRINEESSAKAEKFIIDNIKMIDQVWT